MEEIKEKKKFYTDAVKRAIYKFREKNKGCQTEITKKWQKNNPDKVKEYARDYYEKNKERLLEKARLKYREKTKEKNIQKLVTILQNL